METRKSLTGGGNTIYKNGVKPRNHNGIETHGKGSLETPVEVMGIGN